MIYLSGLLPPVLLPSVGSLSPVYWLSLDSVNDVVEATIVSNVADVFTESINKLTTRHVLEIHVIRTDTHSN